MTEKLSDFLEKNKTIQEESQVTYIMIAARKVLDSEADLNLNKFPVLRFYCDWSLHIKKDRITDEMRFIARELFQGISEHIAQPVIIHRKKATEFAYMRVLRQELRAFLESHSLSTALAEIGWVSFIKVLVKVLEDQPIIDPIPEIKSISFLPAASDCTIFRVDFSSPVDGFEYFQYGNAF